MSFSETFASSDRCFAHHQSVKLETPHFIFFAWFLEANRLYLEVREIEQARRPAPFYSADVDNVEPSEDPIPTPRYRLWVSSEARDKEEHDLAPNECSSIVLKSKHGVVLAEIHEVLNGKGHRLELHVQTLGNIDVILALPVSFKGAIYPSRHDGQQSSGVSLSKELISRVDEGLIRIGEDSESEMQDKVLITTDGKVSLKVMTA
ncbi:hypothetical protein PUNSTDRAFT_135529 [Punctularia strigosozonata HHB-11173 SS5]|uniref:uncharacterized protein n=1 Tax=Punctularia strigosozonata (strain HHB-11173) TaxID=741275 RepID=UPI0004417E90|nr:uncharacterized protein PUNSTDRAFT_135529 [Punctularia strigosozonata HHB-11173 SS5]EIN08012.1 hypothetical protein PUNSTDRAFT_135529 [Punctularia strigosozonata HHB-11173 SS5]